MNRLAVGLDRENADTKASGYAKNWCFTKHYGGVGQPTKQEALDMVMELQEQSNYLVAGHEECPTTGQLHLQGYVQFESKKRVTQLIKYVPQSKFLIAEGDDEKNFIYCSKGGDYIEYGERRDTSGGRAGAAAQEDRWKRARTAAVTNKLADVPDDIFVKCYAAIKSIAKDNLVMPEDADGCCGVWIYGGSGVGKSRKAREDYPGAYFKLANKWWDGYDGQEYVILDDFDVQHGMLGYHLKIWADRYSFIAETKGGAISARPKKFVVTSNYAPEDIWQDKTTLEPIRRRFRVIHMLSPQDFGFVAPADQVHSQSSLDERAGVTPGFVPPTPELVPGREPEPEVVDLTGLEDET